jgi:hypothetical protein
MNIVFIREIVLAKMMEEYIHNKTVIRDKTQEYYQNAVAFLKGKLQTEKRK